MVYTEAKIYDDSFWKDINKTWFKLRLPKTWNEVKPCSPIIKFQAMNDVMKEEMVVNMNVAMEEISSFIPDGHAYVEESIRLMKKQMSKMELISKEIMEHEHVVFYKIEYLSEVKGVDFYNLSYVWPVMKNAVMLVMQTDIYHKDEVAPLFDKIFQSFKII